ncbi:MAG: DUF6804 family protein [Bacteroidota bacterium]
MNSILKIILIGLLVGCLFNMPYGYFQFVRFTSFIRFGYFAYKSFVEQNKFDAIIFVLLALLFQPFEKIALGRLLWNIVDITVALYLILGLTKKTNAKSN